MKMLCPEFLTCPGNAYCRHAIVHELLSPFGERTCVAYNSFAKECRTPRTLLTAAKLKHVCPGCVEIEDRDV